MTEVITGLVKSDKASISYQKHGQGNKTLLTFHGFGQSGEYLIPLNKLGSEYTVYHFDLPLHGDSSWKGARAIKKKEIEDLFNQFFEKESIHNFSMGAFSLGGKLLFTLLEFFYEKVEIVILIAPDGIKTNQWYKLVTMNGPFRWLFKAMVENPSVYFQLADLLKRIGLLDKSIIKFVQFHMDTKGKREHVYRVWTAYKQLQFSEQEIIDTLNSNGIQTYLYLGMHDRVIPAKRLGRFINNVSEIRYYGITSGHNQLIEKVADRIDSDMLKHK